MALGIIYGKLSGIIRRYVVDDGPRALSLHAGLSLHVGAGEAMYVVPESEVIKRGLPDEARGRQLIELFTGKPSPDSRCVVIDANGLVEAVISADPMLDILKGKTLRLHSEATIGWKWDGKTLSAPPDKRVVKL